MPSSFVYLAHGRRIKSPIPLPGFAISPDVQSSQINIEIEDVSQEITTHGMQWGKDGFRIWSSDVADVTLSPPTVIKITKSHSASDELLSIPLQGSVMAFMLHLQGDLVLHGNALVVNNRGIIVLGNKGAGKSTLTAILMMRGHKLLADDVCVVDKSNGLNQYQVHRGSVQMKLWPDSMQQVLKEPSEVFPRVVPGEEKRFYDASVHASHLDHVPLSRIYLLDSGNRLKLEQLSTSESWREIMNHSYASRYSSHLLQGEFRSSHFKSSSALANDLNLKRLQRTNHFGDASELAKLIERDVENE